MHTYEWEEKLPESCKSNKNTTTYTDDMFCTIVNSKWLHADPSWNIQNHSYCPLRIFITHWSWGSSAAPIATSGCSWTSVWHQWLWKVFLTSAGVVCVTVCLCVCVGGGRVYVQCLQHACVGASWVMVKRTSVCIEKSSIFEQPLTPR